MLCFYFATSVLGVSPTDGLGVTALAGVPPPCVLATFAVNLCASSMLNLPV
jgi:hypothetical protein